MHRTHEDADFSGLSLHDHLPLAWEPSTLTDGAELEHYNQETARALQAIALFEEAPRELTAENQGQELVHLEAKVDVLLSLVTRLLSEKHGVPPRHSTVLRADGIEWSGPAVDQARTGESGVVVLYPNPMLPLPFRLGARIVGSVDRGGVRWRLARFEHLSPAVSVGLEKLVFRRHRRQIAISRGTDILTKTGISRAPRF